MIPQERWEFACDMNYWGLGFGIDFDWKSAYIIVGPLRGQLNWNVEND